MNLRRALLMAAHFTEHDAASPRWDCSSSCRVDHTVPISESRAALGMLASRRS